MSELTFIGLDVHARSVAAGVLEGSTGEVRSGSAPVRTAELIPWLRAQRESVSVAYEAGPTGFGLARACAAAGVPCLVAAPSKIARGGRGARQDRPPRCPASGQAAAPRRAYRGACAEPI